MGWLSFGITAQLSAGCFYLLTASRPACGPGRRLLGWGLMLISFPSRRQYEGARAGGWWPPRAVSWHFVDVIWVLLFLAAFAWAGS